jgi:hypothetical protein
MIGAGNPRGRIVLSPEEGEMVSFGGLGVEHQMDPLILAAPIHTPARGRIHLRA